MKPPPRCQHYEIYKTDDNIPKYVKLHIDNGLELLDKIFDTSEYTFFDFLCSLAEGLFPYHNLSINSLIFLSVVFRQ